MSTALSVYYAGKDGDCYEVQSLSFVEKNERIFVLFRDGNGYHLVVGWEYASWYNLFFGPKCDKKILTNASKLGYMEECGYGEMWSEKRDGRMQMSGNIGAHVDPLNELTSKEIDFR